MFSNDKLSISVNSTENTDIINITLVDKSHLVVPGKDINCKDNPQKIRELITKLPTNSSMNLSQLETPKKHQFRRKKKASIQCPFFAKKRALPEGP